MTIQKGSQHKVKDGMVLDEVLEQYGMKDLFYKQIRHNENMTYCIEDRYLLRIDKEKPGWCTLYEKR